MGSETAVVTNADKPTNSTNIVAIPRRPEPTTASEKVVAFAKEHPVLTVAGGVAVGLAISALIPRSFSRKLSKRAFALAEAGATAVFAYGQEALDKSEDAGVIAKKKAGILAGQAERLGERAVEKAEKISAAALSTAGERLSAVAADKAEELGEKATDRLSRLGDAALAQSNKLFSYTEPAADRLADKAAKLRSRIRG
jgi:hypothetical protein